MIKLQGLSKQDVAICNLLWNCKTVEDVERIVQALPPEYKKRAVVMRELIVAAELDTIEDVYADTTAYLQRIAAR
jgi:hypothetical protein